MAYSKSYLILLGALVSGSLADSCADLYYQCGGSVWTGATCCATGTCKSQNDYYYQCVQTEDADAADTVAAATTTSAAAAATTTAEAVATQAETSAAAVAESSNTFTVQYVSSNEETASFGDADTAVASTEEAQSVIVEGTTYAAAATTTAQSEAASTPAASTDEAESVVVEGTYTAVATTTAQSVAESSEAAATDLVASSSVANAAVDASETASSSISSSSSSSSSSAEVISSGTSGTGSTTRYWDCCKPSCSWSGKADVSSPVAACAADGVTTLGVDVQSGCTGGTAYMCTDQQPFKVSDDLAYGFAAVSLTGGSDDSMCCSCYQLTFTDTTLSGKKMIVQATNTGSDLSSNQFDIAMPGGGQGIYSGCTSQWNNYSSDIWGEQYGGVSSASECDALPTEIQSGCDWRFDWFEGDDNPSVTFEQVVCPTELTDITGCIRDDHW